ncbi:hypothetical protein RR48_08326 [Papilio machaon]|uniref:Uncharacterized protein n=1 Tax=Papilio machaon TaxID=76193 RepID=A0A194R244_PAPMA|nr:hypothetical protein RR48_08326 [Papilio machaon]
MEKNELNDNSLVNTWDSDLSYGTEKLLQVTQHDMDVVLKKYNVTHKQVQEIVDLIQDWYEKQPHLPKNKLDDRVIVRLLVATKFRIEKVKDKIDSLISIKHKTPEFLFNRDPLSPIIDEYLRYGFFAVSPKKSPDDHRVAFFRVKSPREFEVIELIKIALMALEYRRYNDVCLGDEFVYDLSNVSFSNAVQMTPPIVTKMVYYILAMDRLDCNTTTRRQASSGSHSAFRLTSVRAGGLLLVYIPFPPLFIRKICEGEVDLMR